MFSVNEVRLLGNVGIAEAPEDGPLKFTMATERAWKGRDGALQTETEWHRITVWRPPAPLVKRLVTGTRVYVAGRLHYSEFKVGEQKRRGTEIVAPASQVEVLAEPRDPQIDSPPDQVWHARPAQDAGDGLG